MSHMRLKPTGTAARGLRNDAKNHFESLVPSRESGCAGGARRASRGLATSLRRLRWAFPAPRGAFAWYVAGRRWWLASPWRPSALRARPMGSSARSCRFCRCRPGWAGGSWSLGAEALSSMSKTPGPYTSAIFSNLNILATKSRKSELSQEIILPQTISATFSNDLNNSHPPVNNKQLLQ